MHDRAIVHPSLSTFPAWRMRSPEKCARYDKYNPADSHSIVAAMSGNNRPSHLTAAQDRQHPTSRPERCDYRFRWLKQSLA